MLGAFKELFHRSLTINSQLADNEPAYSRAEDSVKAPSGQSQTLAKDSEERHQNKFSPTYFDEIKRVPDDDEVSTGLQGLPDKALNYAAEKDNFIRTYGHDYGYNGQLAQMRMDEFRRLHEQVYLDYAGAALYSESQIKDSARELMDQLLCNPHSSSTSASSEALEALRRDTLALLKADGREYEVVITSGATAALKLVAECFPWTPGVSTLAHPLAVHNSVLGMRGPAIAAGAAVQLVRTSAVAEVASASEDGTAAAEPSGRVVAVVGEPVTRHQSATTEDCGARWPPGSYAKKPLQGCGICGSGGDGGGSGGGGDGRGGSGGAGGSGGGRSGVGGVKRFESPQSAAYHLLALPVECNFTGDKEPHLEAVVRHVRQFGIYTAAGTGLTTGTVTEACGDRKGIPKQEDEGCDVAKRRGGGADGGDGSSSGHRWLVLLDAAKACATAPPELSAVPADLVVLSYYKIFGHPTGLGALVVRREVLPLLGARKTYFGGGTVEVAVADRAFHVRRPGPAGLEDGTPPFTSIAAARHGFAFLNRIGGLPAVHRHSRCLARWLAARLAALRHATGAPVCVLYGTWCRAAASAASGLGHRSIVGDLTSFGNPPPPIGGPKKAVPAGGGGGDNNDNGGLPDHGATLAFNLRRADGSWVGYAEVSRLAALHGLHLRTGCFCNPGACASWLGWSAEDLIRHHSSGHVCWDDNDLADGRPTGAVRVSLGAANSFADVFKLLQLIVTYFMDKSHEDGDGGGIGAGGCDGGGDGGGCDGAGGGGGGGGGVSCVHGTSAMGSQAVASRIVAHTAVAAPPAAVSTARWNTKPTDDETEPSDVRLQLATARPESPQLGYGVPPSPPPSLAHPHPHIQYTAGPQTSSSAAAAGAAAGARIGEGGGSKAAVGRLTCIRLYPVKSCAAQVVEAWPVGPTGLLYDREWALVDDGGKVLTLKQCPRMALIHPVVDLVQGTLIIHPPTATDLAPLELAIPGIYPPTPATEPTAAGTGAPLAAASKDGTGDAAGGCRMVTAGADVRQFDAVRLDAGLTLERVQVCGDTVCTDLVNASHSTQGEDRVRNWFARALGAPCRIVQQRTGARKVRRPTGQSAPPRPPTFSAAQPASASASACASASVSTSASANKTGSLSPVAATRGTTAADSDILVDGVVGGGGGRTGPAQGAASEELGVRPEGATHEAVVEPAVGFANDGQYLLVSEESMADLRQRMLASRYTAPGATQPSSHTTVQAPKGSPTRDPPSPQHDEDLLTRLRPNLVVAGFQPYTEDHWAAVRVGPLSADVLGTCPRCELLQVDPRVGVRRGSEVLMALAQYRRRGGRMQFGVLLAAAGPGQPLAAAAAAGPGHTMAAGSEFGSGSVLSSESGSGTLHDDAGGDGGTKVPDSGLWESRDAVVSTGLGSGTGAVGVERRGAVVEEEAVTWLRRRFGQLAVVAVGDEVVPMNAAV